MKILFEPELQKFLDEIDPADVEMAEIRTYPCNTPLSAYQFTYVTIRAVSREAHDRIYARATELLNQKEHIYNLTGNLNAWLTNIINSIRK